MAFAVSSDIGIVILLALVWAIAVATTTFISGKKIAQKLLELTQEDALTLAIKSAVSVFVIAVIVALSSIFFHIERVWLCALLQIIIQYLIARKGSPTFVNRDAGKWAAMTTLSSTVVSLVVNTIISLWLNRYQD
ncbi:MAG: hypothetical protein WCT03_14825 [Candidatus Obscuribacterales bacterium]|jgi:hypothetical protein